MSKKQAPYKIAFFAVIFFFLCHIPVVMGTPNVVISAQVDMDFGQTDYSGGALGSINMGTNGNISYVGSFSGDGIGTAGQFLMTLIFGTNNGVSIACDTNATLTNGAGASVSLTNIEFVVGSGNRTGYGSGTLCQGLGTTISPIAVTGGTSNRTVYIGGSLNISSPIPVAGDYSTANSGGNPMTFVILRL